MTRPAPSAAAIAEHTVPDAVLCRRYADEGDAAAFELLVWRYRRLVAGVCRRALGHRHDAEDAAQAAFLVLARRAAAVRTECLAGWLARVAYRCAARLRGRRPPPSAADVADLPTPVRPTPDPAVAAAVDRELDRLPERYRLPLVLCLLQGRTYAQAAAELGCPLGTLAGRVTRGRHLLRTRLARRGLAAGVSVLAAVLAADGSAAGFIRSVTAAAAAFAAGAPAPGRAAAVAQGVLDAMTRTPKRLVAAALAALLAAAAAATAGLALDPPTKPPKSDTSPPPAAAAKPAARPQDATALAGTWLFDGYRQGKHSRLSDVWGSAVTFTADSFAVTGVYGSKADLTGTFTLDTAAHAIDLTVHPFDLTPTGMPLKLDRCVIRGLYELDGDTLTVGFEMDPDGKRPAAFAADGRKSTVLTLKRAPKGFDKLPDEVTLTVRGAEGKPAGGATACSFMNGPQLLPLTDKDGKEVVVNPRTLTAKRKEELLATLPDGQKEVFAAFAEVPKRAVYDAESGWTYSDAKTTAADGTAKWKREELRFGTLLVRDAASKQMAVAVLSPSRLASGRVELTLQPECKVTVPASCPEAAKAGQGGKDWFNSYVETADGVRIGFVGNKDGKLDYPLPPGEYQVSVYGSELMGSKVAPLTVPKDRSEYTAPAVEVPATALVKLLGKPAPGLIGVAGWKGGPVTLAELKGSYVLLEFWGYWCGPCVGSMPDLIAVHERYHGKGVEVVGVHVDANGEVTTAKQLDEKLAEFKREVWKGKDIPFPVALVSGKLTGDDSLGALSAAYGIRGYPSTILIDRDGEVVGKFNARDAKAACEQIDALLAKDKK